MDNIQIGDIIACYSNRGIISRLIGLITRSKYSHTAIVYDIYDDCNTIVVGEIDWKYQYKICEMEYSYNEFDVYRCKEPIRTHKLQHQILVHSGERYDFADIFRILFKLPRRYTPKRVICSEVIDMIYRDSGVSLEVTNCPTPEELIKSSKLFKVE